MSIITLFTKKAPTIAGIEFDAILEDTIESSVEFTGYPIESGARAADHGIIQPYRWSLIVAVSNNPLKPQVTDFIGGALSNLTNNPLLASIAGTSAGLLAGSSDSRASAALQLLLALQMARESFDIDAGDIQLQNMVIVNIRRTKTPDNETGLFAEVQLQELPTLETIITRGTNPTANQLRDNDPSQSQLAALVNRGEQFARDVGATINEAVSNLL
ncbi:tail fiber protein [Vibrio phage CP-T1]|uniref:Dit-like phage tail protein N-terminal domain-containing protein n=1 Tax=Vibrio phage Rostov M3 TaxID=2660724 RepID=A0A5Q2WEU1_9CAUD|nr:tail fiber protein [Vibrio phage CP-T1]AFC22439.1 hypothetical protein CP-T1_0057 [Vibrio phage CP-T1]AIA08707.1 hypothetical protein SBVc24_0018 [Vibrio phage 24]QGH75035.1 hypothetical protein RostovM3_00016 [Vibrio phage Rostov M3]